MKETLEMMKELAVGYDNNTDLNLLVSEYKKAQCPGILAFLFVKNYGLILQIAGTFKLLTSQDVASFSLQELDKCLMNFDCSRGYQFNTYYGTCLRNRLRHEQQFLTTDLQYANYNTMNLAEYQEIEDTHFDFNFFDLNNYGLSKNELIQCNMIIDGYTMKEIAQYFEISPQAVWYRNKNIGKKLLS